MIVRDNLKNTSYEVPDEEPTYDPNWIDKPQPPTIDERVANVESDVDEIITILAAVEGIV